MFGVEEHECAEQNVWRMCTQLLTLPQMLLFDTCHNIFCEYEKSEQNLSITLWLSCRCLASSYPSAVLTRIIVQNGELLGNIIETIGESFIVWIGENIIDSTIFVKVLLNACKT